MPPFLSNFQDTTFPQAERWMSLSQPISFAIPLAAGSAPEVVKPFTRGGSTITKINWLFPETTGNGAHPPLWLFDAWTNYRMVRWKKIHFKIESEVQSFAYGLMGAVVLPFELQYVPSWSAGSTQLITMESLMAYNPKIWSVNEQTTLEFEAPFNSMYQWLETDAGWFATLGETYTESQYNTVFAHMPCLIIFNLTSLNEVLSLTTSSLTMRALMRFEGLEFNMPVNEDWVDTPSNVVHGESCGVSFNKDTRINTPDELFAPGKIQWVTDQVPIIELHFKGHKEEARYHALALQCAVDIFAIYRLEPHDFRWWCENVMTLVFTEHYLESYTYPIYETILDLNRKKAPLSVPPDNVEVDVQEEVHGDSCSLNEHEMPHSFASVLNSPATIAGASTAAIMMAGASLALGYGIYSSDTGPQLAASSVNSTGARAMAVKTATSGLVSTAKSKENSEAQKANVNPFPADFQVGWTGKVDQMLPFGLDLPVDPKEYSDQPDFRNIIALCKKPGLFTTNILSAASPTQAYSLYFGTPMSNDVFTGSFKYLFSYFSYISQLFRWWRGSLKFCIQFAGSSMISARIRLFISYTVDFSTYVAGSTAINTLMPTMDVTVKGFTTLKFSVPFIYPYDWAMTLPELSQDTYYYKRAPVLTLQLLNITTTGDVTPVIPYVIWYSACDDLEFRFPQHIVGPTPSLDPPVHGDSCMWQEFEQEFPPFKGIKTSTYTRKQEVPITDLGELLTRWTQYAYYGGDSGGVILTPQVPVLTPHGGGTTNFKFSVLSIIGALYAWFSGEQEYSIFTRRISSSGSPTTVAGDLLVIGWGSRSNSSVDIATVDPNLPENGISFMDCDHWSNARVSVPFMSGFAASPTGTYSFLYNNQQRSLLVHELNQESAYGQLMTYQVSLHTSIDRVYFRAGKSFQLMGLLPVPGWAYWPVNPTAPSTKADGKDIRIADLYTKKCLPIFQNRSYVHDHVHQITSVINDRVPPPLRKKVVNNGKDKDSDKN